MNTVRNKAILHPGGVALHLYRPAVAEVVEVPSGAVLFIDEYSWVFKVVRGRLLPRDPNTFSDSWRP